MLSAALPGQKVKGETLFELVKGYIRAKSKRRGARAWIIHRLDKEASGLLVFATSERAFDWLKEDFRAKRVHRLYTAVVEGEFDAPNAAGTVQSFLYEDEKGIVHWQSSPSRPPGQEPAKLAVTHYRVLKQGHGRALVQARLETGRKNQIRAHMGEIKHPIVGDRRYGASSNPLDRICLHATELGLKHPGSGEELRFVSPAPGGFMGLVGEHVPDQRSPATPPPEAPRGKAPERAPAHVPVDDEPTIVPATPRTEIHAHPERPQPTHAPSKASPNPDAERSSWQHVSAWYDNLIEERGSDHHERVILPGVMRLLHAAPGRRVLDVACGQGVLSRRLADGGVESTGIDAAPGLIAAAERLAARDPALARLMSFRVADARELASAALEPASFDAAACVMALMNINPLEAVLHGVASLLKGGGAFVGVILHPAFRAPGQTSWGWDAAPPDESSKLRNDRRARRPRDSRRRSHDERQYRRVDAYLSSRVHEVVMNPGEVAAGKPPVITLTFHRPIEAYVQACARAGLLIDAIEEWASARTSEPGPRASEENRARREIPMFLAFRAIKPA